jgi:hypothetical protein
VHRNELADAPRGSGARISCRLDRADVAPHQNCYVARSYIFGSDQADVCRLDHGVGRLDRANETEGFDHAEGVACAFHLIDRDDIMVPHRMQRRVWSTPLLQSVSIAIAFCAAVSCTTRNDTSPAVGSVEVVLSKPKAALGSPIEVTYRFRVANDAPPLGSRTVFVHFVDADEEMMWTDDHLPPTPTTEWKPGQTVEYTRTVFVPIYPYVGRAKVLAGLYDNSTNERLRLSNPDRGDRSYQVAEFELLPQTENVFLIFKDGWHPAEVALDNPAIEWQWTKKEATLTFRNPKRDSILFLQLDNPGRSSLGVASQVELRIGDQTVATVPVEPTDAPVRKVPLSAAQLGSADMVEIRLVADKTFVPALDPAAKSTDTRDLGVRVFHAFVQPS